MNLQELKIKDPEELLKQANKLEIELKKLRVKAPAVYADAQRKVDFFRANTAKDITTSAAKDINIKA